MEFINYFIRNIKNSNILLCLACEEKRDTGFISLIDEIESIRLDGLKLDEVNTLITSMLGEHRLSAYHIQQIYEEAHGNPLFIRELLKSMMGRVLLFQQGRWTIEEVSFEKLAISKTMKGVFEDQLKGLGEQAYEILRIGSIFGEKFQLSVIKQILNYSDEKLLTALRELLQRQLLTRHTNGYCFVSSQLREIVYNGIEEENRRSLHQTIGDILEEKFAHNIEPIIEELAYHFARGLNREKAFDFLIRAAKKSKSLYANKEAIRYFEQAVALIKPEEKRYSTLLKELGDTYRLVAEHDKAIDKYREVLSLSTPISSEKASLYCDIGISYRNKGEYDYALKSYNQGISIAQEDMDQRVRARLYQEMSWVYLAKADYDKALTIAFKGLRIVMKCKDLPGMEKIYHNLGTICLRKGKWDKAIQYFSKSLELKEKIDNLPGKAASYNNFGVVYSMRGNFAEALEYYKKGFEICKKIRDPIGIARGYKNLGIICYQQGNLTEAEDYYKKSLEIEERIGDNIGLSASYNNIGLIYIQQRRWEEAVNYFNHSLEIKEKLKDIGGIAGCYNNLGSVYKSKGDWDSAAQYYQKSFDLKEKIGDSVGIANSLINLGTIYINKGESEKALYSLEEAKKIGSKIGSKKIVSGAYQSLGLFYLNRKDIEEALKYNMDALKLVIELGNRLDEGIILRTLAKVYQLKKDNVTAEEHLLKSIEVLKETAIEVELAQSYMEIGELKRKTGNTKDSINYLGKAKEIFEELGMEEELEEVKSISKLYVSKDLIGIYQISSIINSILDYRELLNKVMDVAIETLEAERGVLIIKDKETDELKIEVICGVEKNNIRDATLISESIVKDVALKGNSLITTDAGTDSRFYNRKSIIDYHITSVLCVPLKIKEETIGAIYLDHHSVSNIFDQESLSFLTAFANLSAVAIENARLHEKLQQENVYLRQEAEEKYRFENIVGKSKEMKKMYRLLEKVIDTSTNVLLEGETGTGKEIVARTIHYSGPRREKKFIPVDCATIPHTLFEGELFGYIKGTFTGAINDKNGLFIEANEGTLFLDEITNISLELQAKLLRVLQEGEVRRLGEQKYRKVDVRIIAATNTDLKKEVDEGRFRADLYYRLNVIVIKLPPLRERREDIPLLAHHFLDKYAKKMDKKISGFSEGGMKLLFDYDWQGNVRELEHQIERAVTLATTDVITETLFSIDPKTTTLTYGERDKRLLGPEEGSAGTPDPAYEKLRAKTSLKEAVETLEREMILQALRKYKHKTEVAKALGLSRFGLQKKIERYGI
ncbi:MAG: tetratricopeptide repeat protein [Candidatus Stahlbacteria bacterium]|nr:tetratricopeptide repeat protein [Candidatus Stahlbacteria bacterium]